MDDILRYRSITAQMTGSDIKGWKPDIKQFQADMIFDVLFDRGWGLRTFTMKDEGGDIWWWETRLYHDSVKDEYIGGSDVSFCYAFMGCFLEWNQNHGKK